ncbi:MAG: recombination-associated protein RdgC [Endozoicomonadaceae bacterium]|nr:recombination-associated protein RdgC [Endozoicomonadaceae bacterium]
MHKFDKFVFFDFKSGVELPYLRDLQAFSSLLEASKLVPFSARKDSLKACEINSGFVKPVFEFSSNSLIYEGADYLLLKFEIEEKKIKKPVLERRVREAKLKYISKNGEDSLDNDIVKTIKEACHIEELIRTPESIQEIPIIFHKKNNWLAIGSSSAKIIDYTLSSLRDCLKTLPTVSLCTDNSSLVFTAWVAEKCPPRTELGSKCKLKDSRDSAIASYSKQELSSEELLKNISNGKEVCEIQINTALTDEIGVAFSINQDLYLSGLSYHLSDDIKQDDFLAELEATLIGIVQILSLLHKFIDTEIIHKFDNCDAEFLGN